MTTNEERMAIISHELWFPELVPKSGPQMWTIRQLMDSGDQIGT